MKPKYMSKESDLCNLLTGCPLCIPSCHSCGQGLQEIANMGAKAALTEAMKRIYIEISHNGDNLKVIQ